jgi:hypothetical protein
MVMSDSSFDDTLGRVYLIPFSANEFIFTQVGMGGDLGVFDGLVSGREDIQSLNPTLLFRVHHGLISPKRFKWIDKGMFPFKSSLSRAQPYLHQSVGDDRCYLVIYGNTDELVSCSKASEYEPLAVWSHEHIVDRFRQQTKTEIASGGA